MNPIITFILPTIGRLSILQTIQSLKNLKNERWHCIILFDGIPNLHLKHLSHDKHFTLLEINKSGENNSKAGLVRNQAFPYIHTTWTGFIDDDDTLSPYYIQHLEDELESYNDNIDCIIFRMMYKNKQVIPKAETNEIKRGDVGISFCIHKRIIESNILFQNNSFEDYLFLKEIENHHFKIIISSHISYFVKCNYLPISQNLSFPKHFIFNEKIIINHQNHQNQNDQNRNNIYIECDGGLGNILFRIFFGKYIELEFHKNVIFVYNENDKRKKLYEYSIFQHLQNCSNTSLKNKNIMILHEQDLQDVTFITTQNELYLKGYFHFTHYFHSHFDSIYSSLFSNYYSDIHLLFHHFKESIPHKKIISIHIRTTDYIQLQHIYHILQNEYYEKSLQEINYNENEYQILLFTDDWNYCQLNYPFIQKYNIQHYEFHLSQIENFHSIQNNYHSDEFEFILMSLSSIIIMANSTFSLWSSYISNAELIIIPSKWFSNEDIIPISHYLYSKKNYRFVS